MSNWLIIYDIKNAKRLTKVMRLINQYGLRVQLSVYELEADDKLIDKIKLKADKLILKEEDSIVYFKLCSDDWQKKEKYGIIKDMEPSNDYYIL